MNSFYKIRRLSRYIRFKMTQRVRNPHFVSGGIAVGMAVAFIPILGLQSILAYFIALLFKVSRLWALIVTFIVNNPITFLPILYLNYIIGAWICQKNIIWITFIAKIPRKGLIPFMYDNLWPMIWGTLITSSIVGFFTYGITFSILSRINLKETGPDHSFKLPE